MSLNRLLITAVVVENRPVPEVAATYGVSQSWIYRLLARFRAEGDAVFDPRPKRPASNPNAIPAETVDLILEYREKLTATGLDAGPDAVLKFELIGEEPVAQRRVVGVEVVEDVDEVRVVPLPLTDGVLQPLVVPVPGHARAASDASSEIIDVHEFDLAYAHLHVPEMA